MKFLCRALCALYVATCAAHAASRDDEDAATFGDYAPTLDDDLVIYIPKYTVKLGFRGISGVKSSFSGQGVISSVHSIRDQAGVAGRLYHDGYVGLDTRTVIDPAGNAIPISPDGRTNNWKITDATQVDDGFAKLSAYSATITDTAKHDKEPGLGLGVELSLERDLGKVFHSRVKWGVIGGVSVNQFNSIKTSAVAANITKTTDYYYLFGQTIPDLTTGTGYTGPTSSGGVDTTILLGDEVLRRTQITTSTTDVVISKWNQRGAYLTFRAGPTLFVPFTSRFSASVSAGAVLVYAGSTYDVTQSFKPETGDTITQTTSGIKGTLLPGYYVDASLQFAINDNSGLYLGAVYQSSGDYIQTVTSDDELSRYVSRVDLSSLQGIRAGVNFRF